MNILGVSAYFHDASAAILQDGNLAACAEEERFTRIKHDYNFPHKAIAFCLEKAKLAPLDIDYAVFFEKPFVKFERLLFSILQTFPLSIITFRESMMHWLLDKLWVQTTLQDALNLPPEKILFCEHHQSHAASSFFCSPFDEAAILTVDGVGEWTTATLGAGKGNKIAIKKEIYFPHSLGLLYSAFTAFLGFEVNEGEYKVMGMAPYGKPKYKDKVYQLIKVFDDGSFFMDMKYFSYHYSSTTAFSKKFCKLFGTPRHPKDSNTLDPYYADVAASIQSVTEDILLKCAQAAYKETGLKNLCMAGGVALNSVANGRILRETPFENLYIQPSAGDGGASVGAALFAHHQLLGNPRKFVMEHAYWGEEYSDAQIKEFIEKNNLPHTYFDDTGKLTAFCVDEIVKGKVCGWLQGRFEFGPRALGNRSILADPRKAEMKDIVNSKIKFREAFRPFAPVVTIEKAEEYFAHPGCAKQYPSRFMLLVAPVQEDKRAQIPAVTHADGTGRLQVVDRAWNPRYYDLVKQFGDATGVPVLLNTSFNLKGEPIVTTPENAFNTFMKSGLDFLVLGNYVIEKEKVKVS